MADTLVSLPLEMLCRFAARMELSTLIRLQMTCRDLFFKFEFVQRLQEVHIAEIHMKYDEKDGEYYFFFGKEYFSGKDYDFGLSEEEFKETNFRFHAAILNFCDPLGEVAVDKALDCLHRRGTVDQLTVVFPEENNYFSLSRIENNKFMEFSSFSILIQVLKVFSIVVTDFSIPPTSFWQMPSITRIRGISSFFLYMPLGYLGETDFQMLELLVDENMRDSIDLNPVLKKWADGQKTIKYWRLSGISFDDQELFKDFHPVPNLQDKCPLRPLVISDNPPAGKGRIAYLLKRADGTMLRVRYRYFKHDGGLLRIDEIDMEDMEYRDIDSDSENSDERPFEGADSEDDEEDF